MADSSHPLMQRYSQIPAELRALPNWVVWKRELDKKGKPTKVPYCARTHRNASTTNPLTWSTFEDAVEALGDRADYGGIGFVFDPESGIFGFDADHLRDKDTGEIDPEARAWLDQFATYTEVSPSGEGVHAIGYGTLPGPGKKRSPFEVYDQARFFTMTGQRLDDYPATLVRVNGPLAELWELLAKGGGEIPDGTPQAITGKPKLTDAGVVEKASNASNGAAFRALWAGDTSAFGGDDSGADMSLCNRLAFYCGCDAAQMDRLFRDSGLMRGKWDERRGRTTYGQKTIAEAIRITTSVYDGTGGAAPLYVKMGDGTYRNTLTGEVLQELPEETEEGGEEAGTEEETLAQAGPNLTDLGNAQRLVARYGDGLRYVPEWGWLSWNGAHWQRDATGAAERAAWKVSQDLFREARKLRKMGQTKRATSMAAWAFTSEKSSRISAMVYQAHFNPAIVARTDQFDADPWMFTCSNGVINLKDGNLRPPERADYATQASAVAYDPVASAPTWAAFLEKVLPDADVRAFVQRFAGYTLTGSTEEQCVAFLYGYGSNGKSTLLGLMQQVLGSFATHTPPETLMIKQQGGGIPNDIAALAGKRMVTTIEVEDGKRLAESLIKSLTGQDLITARFLHKEFFTFRPAFKVWLAANHKPIIRGTDYAIWRRIHLIPFDVQITEAERKADPGFAARLSSELPGILRWCVEGCAAWLSGGLQPPEAVQKATREYRDEMDLIGPFIEECCALGSGKEALAGALYQSYVAWCQENGDEPLKQRAFGTKLGDRGLGHKRSTGGKHAWKGIGLLQTASKPPGPVTVVNSHQRNSDPSDPSEPRLEVTGHPAHAGSPLPIYISHLGHMGHSEDDGEAF